MIELATLIFAIAAVTCIGFNALCLLSLRPLKLTRPEAFAVSYGLGLGLVSFEMLLFYKIGAGFNVQALIAPWLILAAFNIYIWSRRGWRVFEQVDLVPAASKKSVLELFLAAGILFEVVYAVFRALIKPIESYDAIAIYAIKSKIFFLARSIPRDYFSNLANLFPHPDYPLNIPLSETFLYLSMGSLNDQLVKLIFPLFFIAILSVLYYAVRRFAGRAYALVFTFVLASIPQFNAYATNAYLEVPLAFYCLCGFIFLVRWIGDPGDLGALVISAVMTALAGWTKNEGLLYCVIYTVLVFGAVAIRGKRAVRSNVMKAALFVFIVVIMMMPWALLKAEHHIVNDEIDLHNVNPAYLIKQLPKLGPILYELQKQLFGPKKWNIFWPVFAVMLALNYRRLLKPPQSYALATVVLALGGYILFYMISYVDVVFFASKTWSRFLLDFLPIAVYLTALTARDDITI